METETNEKHISEFLLSEYEHISAAHFESGKSITSFFRYYLLIMSAPAFIFLIFDKNLPEIKKLINGDDNGFNLFISVFFGVIATIGFCISIYIIDKKIQVILYARTVNGIRNYFAKKSKEDISKYLVLPIDTKKPSFFNIYSLISMIIPIGIINSIFLFFSLWVVSLKCLSIWLSPTFLVIHILTYLAITNKKSNNVK